MTTPPTFHQRLSLQSDPTFAGFAVALVERDDGAIVIVAIDEPGAMQRRRTAHVPLRLADLRPAPARRNGR